jgi:alpha/beta superfamily hydrolase
MLSPKMQEAFYFHGSARSLFGVLHEPTGAGEAGVVVMCAPLWREGIRAHHVLRQLGVRLAKLGQCVFRFDYSGAGDSPGDSVEGDVDVWLEDVAAAIDEARRRTGVARVTLFGLRFGATLAALTAARRDDVDRLVLWEPIVSGAHYLLAGWADQRAWAKKYSTWRRLARAELPDGGDEILGFRVTTAMRLSIAAIDLSDLGRTARSVLIVDRAAPDANGGLAFTLASRGAHVDHHVMAEPEVWKQHDSDGVAGARHTLDLVAGWFAEGTA